MPAGLFAARRRGSTADKTAMTLSFIGVSAPQFVTGLILFYIFAYWLSWLPSGGYGAANVILPAVTLGIAGGGWYSRMMRSSMVDVLRQDYIRTARAKGLDERSVLFVHAFRNAVLPIIAMIGLDVGIFMSGVVVVESVYGWPGIGQLDVAGDPGPRHPHHHGGDPDGGDLHRARQPAGGSDRAVD